MEICTDEVSSNVVCFHKAVNIKFNYLLNNLRAIRLCRMWLVKK